MKLFFSVVVPNFDVYSGGSTDGSTPLNTCEMYNPTSRTWTTSGTLRTARVDFRMLQFNQYLVVIGGQNSNSTVTDTLELFDPPVRTTTLVSKRIIGAREVFAASGI